MVVIVGVRTHPLGKKKDSVCRTRPATSLSTYVVALLWKLGFRTPRRGGTGTRARAVIWCSFNKGGPITRMQHRGADERLQGYALVAEIPKFYSTFHLEPQTTQCQDVRGS